MVLAAIARREWLLRMLALAAASCARREPATAASRLTVFYALGSGGGRFESFALDGSAEYLLFEPLAKVNTAGEWEPRLVSSWEHSHDYRTWTIRLRWTSRGRTGCRSPPTT